MMNYDWRKRGNTAKAGWGPLVPNNSRRFGKSDPTPPVAPDPAATTAAQTESAKEIAQYNAQLNRVNQTNPLGSSNWTQDPTTGAWSQSTTYSPAQQGLLNNAQGLASFAISNLGLQPSAFVGGTNAPTLQTSFTNPGVPVTSVSGAGQGIQNQLDLSGVQAIPTADHAAYEQAVNSAYNQATSRLDPQWNQQQTQLQTQLANQGVTQNSDAWNKAMDDFTRQRTDAYNTANNSAIQNGSTLEQALFGMGLSANQAGVGNAVASGNFANNAQAQGFGQNVTAGNFANSAAAQGYGQNLGAAQFGNTANQQMFSNDQANANLMNSATQNKTQDLLAMAGVPNQVQAPNFSGVPTATAQTPDVLGAQSLSTQAQLANYQQQMQNNSAKKGGAGSLAGTLGAAAILSDRRMKTDIHPIGLSVNGLPLYMFRYKSGGLPQLGFMAQEVEKVRPWAVQTKSGIKHVDYSLALAA